MLIEHLVDVGEDEAVASLSIGDLDAFYKDARRSFDADDSFKERSRRRVVLLQSGDAETLRLWKLLVDESVAYFTQVYARLHVMLTPEDVVGESSYNDMLADVVADLDARGLLTESDGALCAFPPGYTNREGEPLPLIVQKRDEGFGYAATDLAAVREPRRSRPRRRNSLRRRRPAVAAPPDGLRRGARGRVAARTCSRGARCLRFHSGDRSQDVEVALGRYGEAH